MPNDSYNARDGWEHQQDGGPAGSQDATGPDGEFLWNGVCPRGSEQAWAGGVPVVIGVSRRRETSEIVYHVRRQRVQRVQISFTVGRGRE